jgi:hypothetical protein
LDAHILYLPEKAWFQLESNMATPKHLGEWSISSIFRSNQVFDAYFVSFLQCSCHKLETTTLKRYAF